MAQAETRRLRTLRDYALLDTPPEANFDRITFLTATMLEKPICTLSLADADRHWFKSRHGVTATEMPRRMSFCDETIKSNDVFVVPDAVADHRFSSAPIVATAPGVRFYAGAPLIAQDGASDASHSN
jgi:GAF domain-containing protein